VAHVTTIRVPLGHDDALLRTGVGVAGYAITAAGRVRSRPH
jgi:hypothetical protein